MSPLGTPEQTSQVVVGAVGSSQINASTLSSDSDRCRVRLRMFSDSPHRRELDGLFACQAETSRTRLNLTTAVENWPLKAPFRITGHTWYELQVLVVRLESEAASAVVKPPAFIIEGTPRDLCKGRLRHFVVRLSGLDRSDLQTLLPQRGTQRARLRAVGSRGKGLQNACLGTGRVGAASTTDDDFHLRSRVVARDGSDRA